MIEILIGTLSGIISGTGMGGGTLLIYLLTNILLLDYKMAQSINLIYFIPTSIIVTFINIKNKNINFKIGILISIFGIIGAIIGFYIAQSIDVTLLKKLFGIFLFTVVIKEIYAIKKDNNKEN